jgi:hypothetical protein
VARFKNISGSDLRVGRADGPTVKAGDVFAVDGEVLEQIDDAYIVGTREDEGGVRAWPKQTWELLPEPTTSTQRGE